MDGGISGGPRDSSQTDQPELEPVAVLHHDAGLTAGHALELRPGTFRLGPRRSEEGGLVAGTPEAVSFDLTVKADGDVVLTTGLEPIAVEGVVIERSAHLDDGDVIQLTTDHFVLRSPSTARRGRAPATITPRTVPAPQLPSMSIWLWLFGLIAVFGLAVGFARSAFFGLMLIGIGGIVATLAIRSRRHERARVEHARQLSNARSLFFREIVDSRKAAAEVLRKGASTPTTVAKLAQTTPRPAGSRLRVTVASGDRTWQPPVVCHRDPGWDHSAVIDELSFLPAIPYTIDLESGPIALVGPRSATLAVARHIATTALVGAGSNTGVSVTTAVPADWQWLAPSPVTGLRVLDGVGGDHGPRTVVIAASTDELRSTTDASDLRQTFTHVIQIDEEGRATITDENGTGSGFVPHGITHRQASTLYELTRGPVIDLRDHPIPDELARVDHGVLDADRLLVTGPNRNRTKDVLATAALRQAARHPDRSIFILDRGDRALIRLAQLDACRRYVTIDQIPNVEFMLEELEALEQQPAGQRVLLLAPDLWDATAFYRNSGRGELADRIDALVRRMQVLPIAATTLDRDDAPSSVFAVWVNAEHADEANVHVTLGDQSVQAETLDLTQLPGADLTGSVARLASPASNEPDSPTENEESR